MYFVLNLVYISLIHGNNYKIQMIPFSSCNTLIYTLYIFFYQKIMLSHRCKILRIVNKTLLQSTMNIGSEYAVGLHNTPLLIYQNCGLNAERLLHIPAHKPFAIGKYLHSNQKKMF